MKNDFIHTFCEISSHRVGVENEELLGVEVVSVDALPRAGLHQLVLESQLPHKTVILIF